MDSLFKGKISDHIKKEICPLLHCPINKIKIEVLPVQQQSNGVDCGIFALAFCLHILLTKSNPVNVFSSDGKLPSHLLHCLKNDKIESFPETLREFTKVCKIRSFYVDVYRRCRMPWKKSENNIYEK